MKILCLTDFPVRQGDRWFWDYVPGNTDEIIFLNTEIQDQYAYWGKMLKYYPQLFCLGWRSLRETTKRDYDAVVAWEGKTGFPLALLRVLHRRMSPPLFILAFSVRGPLKRFPRLQRYGVRGANHFSVPTVHEKEIYAQSLDIPDERIRHLPLGVHDIFGGQFGKEPGAFIFSGGRSGRDYSTFLRAVQGLDIPVIVNARPFNLRGLEIPSNVQVNNLLPTDLYREQNWNSRYVVVPLFAVDEAVGLTAILYAMAAGKAVICSDLPAQAEYVLDGVTGILVPPGDTEALRQAVVYLWERPTLCREMGAKARALYAERYTFGAFADRIVHFVHEVGGAG